MPEMEWRKGCCFKQGGQGRLLWESDIEQKCETDEGAAMWVHEGTAFIPGEGVCEQHMQRP